MPPLPAESDVEYERAPLQRFFSTVSDVAAGLELYAQENDADGAILLVWTPARFLKSLFICLARTSERHYERALDLEVALSLAGSKPPSPNHPFATAPPEVLSSVHILGDVVSSLIPQISSTVNLQPFSADATISIHCSHAPLSDSLQRIVVLLIGHRPQSHRIIDPAASTKLLSQINDFPAVHIMHLSFLRDQVIRSVGLFYQPISSRQDTTRDARSLFFTVLDNTEAFLRLVIKLTGSAAGVWYAPARQRRHFVINKKYKALIPRSSEARASTPPLVELTSVQRHPYLINDPTTFFQLNPEAAGFTPIIRNNTGDSAILTFPVMAYDHSDAPVIAVVLLLATRPFLPKDLAIAEYISDAYRQFNSEFLQRHIERLPHRHFVTLRSPSIRPKQLPNIELSPFPCHDPRFDSIPCDSAFADGVPLEVKDAEPFLYHVLTTLTAFTPCCVANFRAVSVNQLGLVRYLSFVARKLDFKRIESIPLDWHKKSSSAYVAHTGETLRVDDCHDESWMEHHPGLAAMQIIVDSDSSITVPVFMGARLIGILHLESLIRNAFAGIVSVVERLAASLGSEFEGAFIRRVNDTFRDRSVDWLARHKLCDAREELQQTLSLAVPTDSEYWVGLRRSLRDIEDSQRLLEHDDADPSVGCGLLDIIRSCYEKTCVPNMTTISSDVARNLCVTESLVDPLRLIIEELFNNVNRAGSARLLPSTIQFHQHILGGICYLSLTIANSFDPAEMDVDFPKLAFRVPITRMGEREGVGVGMVRAAALAHSFGAHLYLSLYNLEDRRLAVTLDIPMNLLGGAV